MLEGLKERMKTWTVWGVRICKRKWEAELPQSLKETRDERTDLSHYWGWKAGYADLRLYYTSACDDMGESCTELGSPLGCNMGRNSLAWI